MESGSGNPAAYSPEIAESLRFEEQIQSLMSPPGTATSFTALLGLDFESVPLPIFPSNAELVDKAARFSAFAEGEVKAEKEDSGGDRNLAGKRKEVEKSKGSAKKKSKKKTAEENSGDDQKQLPYVHVRARRGQATDNHSLAERARREKINARMKLLQELVPGCSKISGTALVLEETINHVQALQRQVEFLSMKLAGVSPVVDFNGLGIDNCFSTECGRLMAGNGTIEQLPWVNGMLNQMKLPQQIWVMDQHHTEQQEQHKQQSWERDDSHQSHVFINNPSSATSIFCYDSSTPNSVSLANQLKTEVSLPDQLKTEL